MEPAEAAEPAAAPEPAEPSAPAAPAADPAAVQRLQRAMMRVAAARTPEEFTAAQEELRVAANLQEAAASSEPDEYDRAAATLEAELLDAMPGETVEERRKNLGYYTKINEVGFQRAAKRIEAIAERRAEAAIAKAFSSLGLTPDNVRGMVEASRDAEWRPILDDLGPDAKQFLPQAKALRDKAQRLGEELSHEDAMLMASRGKIVATGQPAARKTAGPVVPSAEVGPPPRSAAKSVGRVMTTAEILASFHRASADAARQNGAPGGKLAPGFGRR